LNEMESTVSKKTSLRKQAAGAENTFDTLAKQALDESRKGKTVSLDDYEKKRKSTGKRK